MKKYMAALIMLVILISAQAFADWQNICPNPDVSYCKDIGKAAYNNSANLRALRGIRVGKIIGVAWRPKGSVIAISPAIPSAGIKKSVRTSPRNAYYYIIDDGGGTPFLRQCREIDTKK